MESIAEHHGRGRPRTRCWIVQFGGVCRYRTILTAGHKDHSCRQQASRAITTRLGHRARAGPLIRDWIENLGLRDASIAASNEHFAIGEQYGHVSFAAGQHRRYRYPCIYRGIVDFS